MGSMTTINGNLLRASLVTYIPKGGDGEGQGGCNRGIMNGFTKFCLGTSGFKPVLILFLDLVRRLLKKCFHQYSPGVIQSQKTSSFRKSPRQLTYLLISSLFVGDFYS